MVQVSAGGCSNHPSIHPDSEAIPSVEQLALIVPAFGLARVLGSVAHRRECHGPPILTDLLANGTEGEI
jgi:hypothetical protein